MITNESCSVTIDGDKTDICFKIYSNRIFLILTQYKKFGSFITVEKESGLREFNSDVYSTKTILGTDAPEIHAAARFIAEQTNIDRTLLLTISLKDYSPDFIKKIVSVLNKIKSW